MHEVRIHSGFIERFCGAGWSGMRGKEYSYMGGFSCGGKSRVVRLTRGNIRVQPATEGADFQRRQFSVVSERGSAT